MRRHAKQIQAEVNRERRRAWSQIRTATSKFVPKDTKIVVFDFNAQASFTYNVYANTAWYKITTPKGMNLEKDKLEASFSIPNMDVNKVIAETGFLKTTLRDDYDVWVKNQKKAHQNRYVYVASKRFVNSIAIERLVQEVAWAIATYGSTAEGSFEALEELLELEWADILQWLEELNLGAQISAKAAGDIAKAVRDKAKEVREKGLESAQVQLSIKDYLPKVTIDIKRVYYRYSRVTSSLLLF